MLPTCKQVISKMIFVNRGAVWIYAGVTPHPLKYLKKSYTICLILFTLLESERIEQIRWTEMSTLTTLGKGNAIL